MNDSTDVLVVGAGVIGASCAAHLARAGHRVTVVEAADQPATGSTGRSFGAVRGQWADPLNVELSWASLQLLRDFKADHGIDIGYLPVGYLMLISEAHWNSQLAAVELQRSNGVPVEVIGVAEAAEITPFVTDGIVGATLCRADGFIDPSGLTRAYLDLAEAAGATVRFGHPVRSLTVRADGAWEVEAGPASITAQYVVNAAGGWGGELGALAGLPLPVVHSRRSIYAADATGFDRSLPMTIDFTSGVFLRTRGDHVLFSLAPTGQAPGYFDVPDWDWFETVYPAAVARFPWLGDLPLDRAASWGGTYEVTPDMQGILGAHPDAPTWVNACGFSGHGLMQSPVIGRLVTEQISAGAISSFDVSGLRVERFADAGDLQRTGLVF
ncbi:MAG: FAD-dependent oxidoreductase [Microlunatus sp.]